MYDCFRIIIIRCHPPQTTLQTSNGRNLRVSYCLSIHKKRQPSASAVFLLSAGPCFLFCLVS